MTELFIDRQSAASGWRPLFDPAPVVRTISMDREPAVEPGELERDQ